MREITSHVVEGDSTKQLKIEVTDAPGAGGASHRYVISGYDGFVNRSQIDGDPAVETVIIFQNGGIVDHDLNGLSQEALLAIVKDRLECFQNGEFPSQENATALQNVNEALRALQKRTMARIKRGVEGKSVA